MEVKGPRDVPSAGRVLRGAPGENSGAGHRSKTEIVVEIWVDKRWVDIGHVGRTDSPGTMTDRSFGEQAMLLFGWFLRGPTADELEERPLVTRTDPDFNLAIGPERLFAPGDNTAVLADLTNGPYQKKVLSGDPICVRWTLQET